MTTGQTAITTGIYRTDCACDYEFKVDRGMEFPRCPKCREIVAWVYQRSAYVPPPQPPAPR